MTELPTPLRRGMITPVSEVDARRLWRSIGARRAKVSPSAWDGVLRAAFTGAGLAALVLLAVAFFTSRLGAAGAVAMADGSDLGALEAPVHGADVLRLSDGSVLTRDSAARLRVLENDDTKLAVLVEAGRVRFDVKKGGPRRWVIECGLVSLEVVGTSFEVDRTPSRVRVDVLEGVVLARGEKLPDRVRRLSAGESLDVNGSADPESAGFEPPVLNRTAPVPAPPPSAPGSAVAGRSVTSPEDARAGEAARPWRELAKSAKYVDAYQALGEGGVAKASSGASVDDLLALADVARLSGHPGEAVAPLRRIADEHAGDPRAPLAMFTLGQILLGAEPAVAAARFEQAIAMGLPSSLVEDARAHVVEARARAGDREGARAAAARYAEAYPQGRHLAAVRRFAGVE